MAGTLTVLHLCSIKGRGGTGYMAARLCRLLRDQGVRVLVGACAHSKMDARARAAGLERLEGLHLLRGFHPRALAADVRRIRACVRRENVDIVHAWHSIEYWTAAAALLGLRARLARTRGLVTPFRATWVNRLIHRRTALVHAACTRIAERYREAGFDMRRVRVVHDGVDLDRYAPGGDPGPVRREAGVPPDAPVVAAVGRLEPVKGHRVLLEAFAQVRARAPQAHLVLAGDGSERPALEARAGAEDLRGAVRFLGVRKDVPAVLAAADVFALASVGSEGSSRATLEAMAAGLPVVASAVGTLPDLVREGETGLLAPPGDAQALADGLCALVADPARRRTFGRAARARAEAEFDERRFARRMKDLYAEATQCSP